MEIHNFLALFLYFLSILLPGFFLVSFLNIKKKYMLIALSYGLGSSLIASELFIYFFILRLSFSFYLYILMFLQAIICLILIIKNNKDQEKGITSRWKLSEIFVAGLIVVCILFSVFQAVTKPPIAYDAVANWSKRAKILLRDGNVNFIKNSDNYLVVPANASYPWQTSLSEYWLRQLGSGEVLVNIIPLGYYICIILALYFCFMHRLNRFSSIALVFLFASMPLIFYHSFNTYADLPLSYFLLISMILLTQWLNDKTPVLLYFSGIFIGMGLFVKNEGIFAIFAWLLSLVLIKFLYGKKISVKLLFKTLGFLVGSIILWLGFKQVLHLGFSSFSLSNNFHTEVFSSLATTLFVHNSWNIWWFIFLIIVILKLKYIYKNRELWPLCLFFLVLFILTISVFLFTEYYQYALNFSAIERTMIPLIPISILLIGYLLEEKERVTV